MASMIPNVPGTGNSVPVSTYTAGVSESYPNVNRQRIIEASINSKEKIDVMPVNVGVNQVLSDRYLEFRINGVVGSFLDLSSLNLELGLNFTQPNGNPLANDTTLALANGIGNTLFKSASVYINEKIVESNPLFNYTSYIKLLKEFDTHRLQSLGLCGGIFDNIENVDSVVDIYTDAIFAADSKHLEKKLQVQIKAHGVDIYFPLLLDVCSMDMYLLDGMDVKIRLELANQAWFLNTLGDINNISLKVNKAKLWIDRVIPHYNALGALNKALTTKPIEYIFRKMLYKTYIVSQNESSIMIDQPWGNVIPEKLTMMFVNMNSFSGSGTQNGLYFSHLHLSNTHITINGSTLYNINTDFPNGKYSRSYYETQNAIGNDNHNMITYKAYKGGRSIFCFTFVNESVQDTLPIEMSASLRINLTFAQPAPAPYIIILLADTTGLITVDEQRTLTCDVRG